MSKSQLQTNNTRLASLIDELKGKATGGGSGSVETCYIKFSIPVFRCWYVAYENGAIITKTLVNVARDTIVEAVCNTIVFTEDGMYSVELYPNSQAVWNDDFAIFRLDAEPGETAIIIGEIEL